ncbi:unnamed protein product [Soboliphyme baturini]|uniref:Transposase n=1 Tax=Soboliphyme baturini TaxID=241478 RepID=A0A183I8U1_9BILA|nr:unnamed protein product [Soboliphyme baturini]
MYVQPLRHVPRCSGPPTDRQTVGRDKQVRSGWMAMGYVIKLIASPWQMSVKQIANRPPDQTSSYCVKIGENSCCRFVWPRSTVYAGLMR